MHEESDIRIRSLLRVHTEGLGEEKEMVVVHPDQIAWLVDFCELFSIGLVCFQVGIPVLGF